MKQPNLDQMMDQLWDYLHGQLPADQVQPFEQALRNNPSAISAAVDLIEVMVMTREVFKRSDAAREELIFNTIADPNATGASDALIELARLEGLAHAQIVELNPRKPKASKTSRRDNAQALSADKLLSAGRYVLRKTLTSKPAIYTYAAAAILLALILINPFANNTPAPQQTANNTPSTKPAETTPPIPRDTPGISPGTTPGTTPVATLTATHNATWATTQAERASARGSHLSVGSPLHPGTRLTLTQGFAQITTARGAIAILEAPATIELLDNDNALHLHTGKLVGICETDRSQGFTVLTEHARIVDLGTVFGVEHKDGHTLTTVFDGEVAVSASEADQAQPVYLTPGQIARVDAQAHVQRITATPQSQFVRQWQTIAQPPHVTGQIEYQPALPASLATGVTESNQIQLYPEARGVQLDRDFRATLTEPGKHETFAAEDAQPIGETRVDSYLAHYDFKVDAGDPKTPRRATIRFDRPILGLIADGQSLFASDPLFAPIGVDFGPSGDPQVTLGRGLESKGGSLPDIVELSEDRRTLTLELYSWMAIDQFRILVQSPEPIVQ